MHFLQSTALAATVATVSAQVYKGFNYGASDSAGAPFTQDAFEAQFNAAKNLVGTSGFTSARIFTLIQAGTTNTPSDAIQAAINTDTSLLLGLWASAGQTNIDNELAALSAAISTNGQQFADAVAAISVGSEDLYRISPTGIENMSGVGAGPDVVSSFIGQVKQAITNTPLAGKLVGHVDTWTAWVNGSNSAVIDAADFIGTDAYPYFQDTMANSIDNAYSLFLSAYDQTVAAAGNKPVWVTETGWPVSGDTRNLAEPSTSNAQTYWDQVGCGKLFDKVNTYWFTLQDAFPTTPSPSFGVVGAGSSAADVPTTPLYNLNCTGASSVSPASASALPASADQASSAQAGGNNGAQRQNTAEQSGQFSTGSSSAAKATTAASTTAAQGASSSSKAASVTASPAGGQESGSTETVQSTNTVTISSCPGGCDKTASVTGGSSVPSTLITKTSALPSASAGPSGCPASLSGTFEYPHLIVPVSKDKPDSAQGTSFNGTISSSTSSIFNFDIPTSDNGKTCTLVFLLPEQSQLTTSAFSLSGSGGFDVERLTNPATEQTTYNSVPDVQRDLGGPADVVAGQEYVIASGACQGGTRIGYKVSATGSLDLNYFQDYNPSPIGFYITVC